jgi:Arc/MetJ-type ribon-helix-helix transcriptional regulator
MATHTIELPETLDRFVRDQIALGEHKDVQGAIVAGLELLQADAAKMARFMAEVQIGIDQFERGEFIEITDMDAYFEDVRARVDARLKTQDDEAADRAA